MTSEHGSFRVFRVFRGSVFGKEEATTEHTENTEKDGIGKFVRKDQGIRK